eukprot:2726559-Prymnesium_polylepis.1
MHTAVAASGVRSVGLDGDCAATLLISHGLRRANGGPLHRAGDQPLPEAGCGVMQSRQCRW